MTYPVISKHFRYFFQCLQIQVEETYFFHEAIVIFTLRDWTCKQKYNWKIFIFCPFLLLFHLFIYFQTFSYFFQFLSFQHVQVEETYSYFSSFFRFRWKKPISSSKPSQFPGSNEHVNSNATVKYWYSAQLCCCFISLDNYYFLQEKILPTRYSSIFKQFLPLQVEETYFFQEAITVSGFTSLGRNSNKIFILSTFFFH